jgi:hypothetical protein
MKKVFITLFMIGSFALVGNAQQMVSAEAGTDKPQLSKEEKQKQKEKKDADQIALYKAAGLNDEEIKKVMEINAEAGKKSAEVRKDASLTEDQKKEKLEAIKADKNAQTKEIMGKERGKKYNELKKEKAAETN